jgi:DNA polymerase-3 subunit epsilon
MAEELARRSGFRVSGSVTKKVDLLVAADPETLSGKAVKARRYGIPIMSEREFWQRLSIRAD